MLAMQYSFTLPADYDMEIIKRRITEKGHLMDQFPHLVFKAFVYACRNSEVVKSRENLYAPFYVWDNTVGMNTFLCGDGFKALTHSFGRPQITLWSVLHAEISPSIAKATAATREIISLPSEKDLASLKASESKQAIEVVGEGRALAAVVAFEPLTWTLVRFRLWQDLDHDADLKGAQAYRVGHMALSGRK